MSAREHTLIGHFLAAAEKHPDRPAIRFTDSEYSYNELLRIASVYGNALRSLEEPSAVIAIVAGRGIETYAGILGILLAGKGYLPLNPSFPAGRNRFMLEKAGTRTLMSGEKDQHTVQDILSSSKKAYNLVNAEHNRVSVAAHDSQVSGAAPGPGSRGSSGTALPGDTAYLLFTSGSTGSPKGVAVSNRNVVAYLDHMLSQFDLVPDDRFTQTFDLTFDLSVHDLFLCWSAGACLCIPDDNSSFGLSRYLREMQPTVWFSVPSVAVLMERMRLLKGPVFPWLRLSFFCGEALLQDTAAAWQTATAGSPIVNLYGPTEATIAVSAYALPEDAAQVKTRNGIVSIGKLFPGHSFVLKDEEKGRGKLCIAGPQVVGGYFRDEELTREYFFDAGTPSRFYNTGDLVEADKEGDLFFLGRADSEVKISGYRVNLMEIDHVLVSIEGVEQAATLYLKDPGERDLLVAFLVSRQDEEDTPTILQHCRRRLPQYMLPEKIIFVDALPLNPNGKTDRRALDEIFRKHYE